MSTLRFYIRHSLFAGLFFIFLGHTIFANSAVKAHVDRASLSMGEAVNLVIRIDNDSNNSEPDLEPLKRDFNLISEAQQSQISIINGNSSSVLMWYIGLSPRHEGKITIPAIKVGDSYTQPISIEVSPNSEFDKKGSLKDIFIKTKVDSPTPYLQSQVIYTVQLFYDRNVQNAELTDPDFQDGTLIRLGKDVSYQKTLNGLSYQVVERKYAIVPEKTGDLTILAPVLTGNVIDHDNLPSQNFQMLNAIWKPIRVTTNPITLSVKPIPAGVSQHQWLPAKSLSLKESWSPSPLTFQVGEPVTRTITIEATGIAAEKLPLLEPQKLSKIQIYPDKPQVETNNNGKEIVAKRIIKMAMIPTEEGTLQLPSIQIKWWNTTKNAFEIASLPSQTLSIFPAPANKIENTNSMPAASLANNPTESTQKMDVISTIPSVAFMQNYFWMGIALVIFILWLLTLGLWRRSKKPLLSSPHPQNKRELQKELEGVKKRCKKACLTNNPVQCKQALIAMANLLWQNHTVLSLGDIEKCVTSIDLKKALHELDKCIYMGTVSSWNGQRLWQLWQQEITVKKKSSSSMLSGLPKLYPE